MWNGLGEEIWDQSSLEALSPGRLIVLSNTCLGGTWNSVKWGGGGNLENHFSFLDLHVFICGLRRWHEKLFRKFQTKILQTDEETMTSYLVSLLSVQQCAQTACASKIILQPHFLKRGLPQVPAWQLRKNPMLHPRNGAFRIRPRHWTQLQCNRAFSGTKGIHKNPTSSRKKRLNFSVSI